MIVWLLFREVSDRTGTDELAGIFLTEDDARTAEETITDRRTFVTRAPTGRVFSKGHRW